MQIGGNAQRIRPVSLLGEGRDGFVCVGMDEVLHRRVVVRKLARRQLEPDERRLLIEETRVLSRLDHPNLLRIYDYHEEEAHDVFTIEYASGLDLPKALEEGLDFAKKVRMVMAVASALAVAHRYGIVHGALSPEAVVVTEGGEVKLVDFVSTSTKLKREASASKWQSPEQTRGEKALPASDMYSFGLLLRELFGETDRDVRALVTSLVREAPSERATAAAALIELQRLGRRRARRLRTAIIVLVATFFVLGAVKYAVDLQRERREALAAKAEADARRAEAIKLVSFMITDLRPKLESVGRLDIMDSTTAKGLDYFASVNPDSISPNEYALHMEAINQLGQVHVSRSNLPAALEAYRRAIGIGETMLRRYPGNLELRYALAHVQARAGIALDRAGDLNGALRHSRAFADLAADLVRRAPQDARYLQAAAIARSNLGSIHERREENAAALREYETAVAIERRAIALGGSETMLLELNYYMMLDKAAMARFKDGRFADARKALEGERGHLEAMANRNKNNALRYALARYDHHLALVAVATGDLRAAARHAANHLSTAKALVAFDPANVDWTNELVAAKRTAGTIARLDGDYRAALDLHADAVTTLSGMIAGGRRTTAMVRDLGLTRVERAQTLLAAGYAAAASEEAHRAVAELRQIEADLPARRTLGDALFLEGESRAARGDRDAAASLWRQALAVLEPLDALSTDPRVSDSHARVLVRLGRAHEARSRIEELAIAGYRHPEYLSLINGRVTPMN